MHSFYKIQSKSDNKREKYGEIFFTYYNYT